MQIYRFRDSGSEPGAAVVTIGNFDGVHLGHQALVRRVVSAAREKGAHSALLTFEPHPQAVLRKRVVPALTSLSQRLRLFEQLGLDAVHLIPFTRELAEKSAESFVREYLIDRFRVRRIVIGYDFAFGRNREGTAEVIKTLGERHGFAFEIFPAIRLDGEVISSSRVRDALAAGDFAVAERLLGRPFAVEGAVAPGERRGRKLGFPTLNLLPEVPLPLRYGVYAARVRQGEASHPGVCNYGVRPTVDGHRAVLETHLFDFAADLYGETIEVVPVRFLRAEQAFGSLDELRAQIALDVREAKGVLAASEGA